MKCLADMCKDSVIKPARSHGSRWASHKLAALRAVFWAYSSIIAHFEDMASGERCDIKPQEVCRLKGYIKQLKSLKFLYHCNLYIDVLEEIAKMLLIFQSDDTAVHCIAEMMDSTIAALLLMKTVDGQNLKSFKDKIVIADGTCKYGTYDLQVVDNLLLILTAKVLTLSSPLSTALNTVSRIVTGMEHFFPEL